MNILVDGPDGSGKSTLCMELIMKGFQYIHSDRPINAERYFSTIDHILATQNNVVLDRGPISNIIYSYVFEGGANTISKELAHSIFQKIDVIILAVPLDKGRYVADFNDLKDNRSERYATMSQIYDEYRSQELFADLIKNNKIIYYDRYKVNKDQIEEFVEENILNVN